MIYLSTNWGNSWQNMEAPQAVWSSVTSSADGYKLAAVVNGGGIYTWQSTPTPALNIVLSGSNAVVSWTIPSTDFALQENSDLTSTNWTDAPVSPALNLTNLQDQVMLSTATGNVYYRLKH